MVLLGTRTDAVLFGVRYVESASLSSGFWTPCTLSQKFGAWTTSPSWVQFSTSTLASIALCALTPLATVVEAPLVHTAVMGSADHRCGNHHAQVCFVLNRLRGPDFFNGAAFCRCDLRLSSYLRTGTLVRWKIWNCVFPGHRSSYKNALQMSMFFGRMMRPPIRCNRASVMGRVKTASPKRMGSWAL